MLKNACTFLILFSSVIIYGQNFTLLKNYNPKTKELKHSLNKTRDSLILGCDKTILKVEIFNEDYEKIIPVNDHKAQIALHDIPVGRFVVEAKLVDKIVIMNLIKHDYLEANSNSKMSRDTKGIVEGKGMMLDENLNAIKTSPNRSIEFILTRGTRKKNTHKKQNFYWVLSEVNNKIGSSKTMRLVDKKSVDRMIKNNKLEHNTVSGRLNELTVWEVYNTSKFMRNQMSNPNFIYSSTSDLFNVVPYYSKESSLQSL